MFAAPSLAPRTAAPLSVQVTYAGSGRDATAYHSTPPNQGGGPDHDSAADSETQRWSVRFSQPLLLGVRGSAELTGASGPVRLVGTIDHVHRDGLYAQLNASEHCTVRYAAAHDSEPHAEISVRYTRATVTLQALDPIPTALLLMPTGCPGQGDSIDGLADNYFEPGYSPIASGYGPGRWFTSGRVTIRRRSLTRTGQVHIRLGLTPTGRSPRNCNAGGPAYASCSFSGNWTARVILTVRRATT